MLGMFGGNKKKTTCLENQDPPNSRDYDFQHKTPSFW